MFSKILGPETQEICGAPITIFAKKLARRIWCLLTFGWSYNFTLLIMNLRSMRPRTFNGHILRKAARDRDPMLKRLADKFEAREYVSAQIGSQSLPRLYQQHESGHDVEWDELPREFVVKVNHLSGGVIIVSDSAPREAFLPTNPNEFGITRYMVHPTRFDPERAAQILYYWLNLQYGWRPCHRPWLIEWAYLDMPRRVIVEELLSGEQGALPNDYKFFVFNGQVKLIQVDLGRFVEHKRQMLYPPWVPIQATFKYEPPAVPPPPPPNLQKMIATAELLARHQDFVRVDLYDLGDRVVFGEFTFYPEAASARLSPRSFRKEWGKFFH